MATLAIIRREQQALLTMRLKLCVRYLVPPQRKQKPACKHSGSRHRADWGDCGEQECNEKLLQTACSKTVAMGARRLRKRLTHDQKQVGENGPYQ